MRKISIHSKEIAYDYVKDVFKGLDHEELWILFVNCRNIPISLERITSGGWDSTIIDLRQIFSIALNHHATAMFLFHNHLSGSCSPSLADIKNTDKLKKGGDIMGIDVVDHIIVCDSGFYSFADESTTNLEDLGNEKR